MGTATLENVRESLVRVVKLAGVFYAVAAVALLLARLPFQGVTLLRGSLDPTDAVSALALFATIAVALLVMLWRPTGGREDEWSRDGSEGFALCLMLILTALGTASGAIGLTVFIDSGPEVMTMAHALVMTGSLALVVICVIGCLAMPGSLLDDFLKDSAERRLAARHRTLTYLGETSPSGGAAASWLLLLVAVPAGLHCVAFSVGKADRVVGPTVTVVILVAFISVVTIGWMAAFLLKSWLVCIFLLFFAILQVAGLTEFLVDQLAQTAEGETVIVLWVCAALVWLIILIVGMTPGRGLRRLVMVSSHFGLACAHRWESLATSRSTVPTWVSSLRHDFRKLRGCAEEIPHQEQPVAG